MKSNFASILAFFVASAATPVMAAGDSVSQAGGCCGKNATAPALKVIAAEAAQPVAAHEEHAGHMLEGYAVVSTALYKDDLAAAQKAATGMVKHDKESAMAKPAQAIAYAKSIEDARKHFKALSDVAIPIAKDEKKMHVAHCPMAMGGKGANWLQKVEDEVQNPYMGAKMPHCGKIVK